MNKTESEIKLTRYYYYLNNKIHLFGPKVLCVCFMNNNLNKTEMKLTRCLLLLLHYSQHWSKSKPFIKVVLNLKTKCIRVLGQLWLTFLIHFKTDCNISNMQNKSNLFKEQVPFFYLNPPLQKSDVKKGQEVILDTSPCKYKYFSQCTDNVILPRYS